MLVMSLMAAIMRLLSVGIEGLPIPLHQGDNDASSLLQALVVYLKLA
jgi:hypothetical protein